MWVLVINTFHVKLLIMSRSSSKSQLCDMRAHGDHYVVHKCA